MTFFLGALSVYLVGYGVIEHNKKKISMGAKTPFCGCHDPFPVKYSLHYNKK